jgi:hypothetical protein
MSFLFSRAYAASTAIRTAYSRSSINRPGPGFEADEDIVPDVDLADAADLLARLMEIGV